MSAAMRGKIAPLPVATPICTDDPAPPGEGPVSTSGQEPAAAYAPWARNTVNDVLAAGSGPGTEALHGFLDNTVIFKIIAGQL